MKPNPQIKTEDEANDVEVWTNDEYLHKIISINYTIR